MEIRRALFVASALGLVAVPAVRHLRRRPAESRSPLAEPIRPALERDDTFPAEWNTSPEPLSSRMEIHTGEGSPEPAQVLSTAAVATLDPPAGTPADVVPFPARELPRLQVPPPRADLFAPLVVPVPQEVSRRPEGKPRGQLRRMRRSIMPHLLVWAAVVLVTVAALIVIVVAPSVGHSLHGVWERIVRGIGI